MADTCNNCFAILAVGFTEAPSKQLTTKLTNLTWGYNLNMAKTGNLGFPITSTDTSKKPIFEPFTPEQEKLYLQELENFGNFSDPCFFTRGEEDDSKQT